MVGETWQVSPNDCTTSLGLNATEQQAAKAKGFPGK
jgi:hypothetical protein